MSHLPRRVFLRSGLGLGGSLLFGCSSKSLDTVHPGENGGAAGNDAGNTSPCAAFAGGERLGVVAFIGESDTPLEQPFNSGLDGRLYTDLSKLDSGNLITPSADFYIRTRYPDLLVPEPRWSIAVGPADAAATLFLDDLMPMVESRGVHLLECSGNARGASFGLLSSAEWSGVRLLDALAGFDVPPSATRVLVSGFDQYSQPSQGNRSLPGASWVFSFDDLERTGAFLATELNGQPLPADHGAPVRLLVPGWYGCTCIKWVNEIRFVGEDEPATAQMTEFASRTAQTGVPTLARDYLPAEIDVAAMPVRIEKWRVDGQLRYRVVGIEWGGPTQVSELEIRFGSGDWQRLSLCAPPTTEQTWTLWEHAWRPLATGTYAITLRVPDPSIRTRRLDSSYYLREVTIDEV